MNKVRAATGRRALHAFFAWLLLASASCHTAPAPQRPTVLPPPPPARPGADGSIGPERAGGSSVSSLTLAPPSELAELDLSGRFGAYAARDAVWAGQLPLLVNRGFDFSLALAMDAAGAGIAVVKRRQGNAALVQQLGQLAPIDAQAVARKICEARPRGCPKLTAQRARSYAFLFGERAARLRVVLEAAGEGIVQPCTSISSARPVRDFAEASILAEAFEAGLQHAIALFEGPSVPASTEAGQCDAGDGLLVAGKVLSRDAERVVIAASEPSAIIQCPAEAFTAQPVDAPATR